MKPSFLLKELVRRDFQARYAGSALGLLWSFLPPLWQLMLFTFVFGWVLKVPLEGETTDSFAVFVFCALLPWAAFQEGVTRGMTALVDNASVVKKMRVSLRVLVLAPMWSALIHQALALAAFVVVLGVQGRLGSYSLLLLVPALIAQVFLTAGLALLLGALHPWVRDLGQVVPMLMTGWMYFTPIIYPISQIPETAGSWIQISPRAILELNPLTPLVELYRRALLGGSLGLDHGTTYLLVLGMIAYAAGAALFAALEKDLIDDL